MVEPFAKSGDPDQTQCTTASDLGLHCLPLTRLGVWSLVFNGLSSCVNNIMHALFSCSHYA